MNMHLDLIREPTTRIPSIQSASKLTSLRVWHCKYPSLSWIQELTGLRELVIGTYPHEDLKPLGSLAQLAYLQIAHLPKLKSISALQELRKLSVLSLATAPSWEASGKVAIVDSIAPIAKLQALRHLELFGCGSEKMRLVDLHGCTQLNSARFAQYPKEEVELFYAKVGASQDYNPPPHFNSDSSPS